LRYIYSTFLYLLTPFVLLRLCWLGLKNADYWRRWPERFGYISFPAEGRNIIWIHAVSVGEVQAATPLVSGLISKYPDYQILITTVTPTGSEMVKRRFSDTVLHYYLPYDLPNVISRFIGMIRPSIFIVLETELWPNLYWQCNHLGIPIVLVNARMTPRSFSGYKKLGTLSKQMLLNINLIAAQASEDGNRFISLGADPARVTVTGNIKFDVNVPHSIVEEAQSLRRYFSENRSIWIAASTHEGEEQLILSAHRQILESHKDCLLIIAPRHPVRFEKVAELCVKNGFQIIRKSEMKECGIKVQVYLLDTLGDLPVHYAASDLAFVGGSLLPFGGHNVLEPASIGIPVITGKHTQNFSEINELLLEKGAEWKVSDVRII